jgi:hypothetical protein
MVHARRILLLVNTHGRDTGAQALQEAVELGAYGSDHLHNILEHRRSLPSCHAGSSRGETRLDPWALQHD